MLTAVADDAEYKLTQSLLAGYNPAVRPSLNFSEPLKVIFGVSIHHIIDVVSNLQYLSLLIYYKLYSLHYIIEIRC